MEIIDSHEALIVRNSDLDRSRFSDANLTGMKIDDVLVSELIRVYEQHSK